MGLGVWRLRSELCLFIERVQHDSVDRASKSREARDTEIDNIVCVDMESLELLNPYVPSEQDEQIGRMIHGMLELDISHCVDATPSD